MKIGIIAGSGNLPFILAQEIIKTGKQPIIISITKDFDERLSSLTSEFYRIGAGQVKKIINTLSENGVEETAIIGKVSKDILFNPIHLDVKAIKILCKLKDRTDSSIFRAVAEEIESNGLRLIDQRLYLNSLLPPKGILTKHRLLEGIRLDIEYGMDLAKKIAEFGIGQTVIVKERIPIAIEAIEGTDETILRGGKLCPDGIIVAKASMPNQDFRFDVPTVGPDTIDVLIKSKATALAIESGKAFLLDAEESIRKANEAKISIVVI